MESMEFQGIHGILWNPWNSMDSMEYSRLYSRLCSRLYSRLYSPVRSGSRPVPVPVRFRSGSGSGIWSGSVPIRSGPSGPVSGRVWSGIQYGCAGYSIVAPGLGGSRRVQVGRAGCVAAGGSRPTRRDPPDRTERNATRTQRELENARRTPNQRTQG